MIKIARITLFLSSWLWANMSSGCIMARAWNMCKTFSLVPSKKLVTRENWDKLNVYFSTFEWQNLHLYQKKSFSTWKFGKISVWVNLIIQKLKSLRYLYFIQRTGVRFPSKAILVVFWKFKEFKLLLQHFCKEAQ